MSDVASSYTFLVTNMVCSGSSFFQDHSQTSSKLLMDGILNNLSGLFKTKCEVFELQSKHNNYTQKKYVAGGPFKRRDACSS